MERKTKYVLVLFGLVAVAIVAKMTMTGTFSEDERRLAMLVPCLIYGAAWALDRFDWKRGVPLSKTNFSLLAAVVFGLLAAGAVIKLILLKTFTPEDFKNVALVAIPIWAIELLLRKRESKG